MNPQFRIGFGYDVHEFTENRKLILGGVEIPHTKGLLGHSDADVLLHAICDAMLGALALGDIGMHFPNSDEKYKDADSRKLLKHVDELIHANGYEVSNIDSTVLLQQPKLSPYVNEMRRTIAEIVNLSVSQISIKATTTESLGFVGREEGCAAHAVVLLNKNEN
ncbi:MAG: 2-C-methyl-D-erythritol 2,4-cyclodiphosphate synthase [Stygiobacter sp. RIFOXYC12_FULL_38_8]|nr:MAG: 2-C-methyl-D-erythritol 2,4-cyclodiphosphate synthase [Stygiobacter sp. GWC2_38_9]OGU83818.1 MAG: 2-C-methyl-D-erythritol 2,4-cyclodiphosphate synthase [Stygiobacter sp. RIFOXYA12_FULL_38_9]OGV07467.1 MAG: 2-C-methyl-D-erythritol 2,4-cyclodiphosphate synthase [Stygiobacter sp. RIFOXYB2_FULL_37_11]OGV12300.1 MAG: 2-C-methyl-D-erythritol 2,4-cyclodiphosphate synthase [Stygiobacter sp. RIFOXYA2_FULL_38_8]OGV13726.1 MAG: 2-C-methyl-D-erythritol 2,4-cyclodiphosphate synthase [Stygiobacter sp